MASRTRLFPLPVLFAGLTLLLTTLTGSTALAQAIPAITAVSPGGYLSPAAPTTSVAVTIARSTSTPILGYSVDFTVSSNLTVPANGITNGLFISANNPNVDYHVRTLGPGHYVADGVTLGNVPQCGSSATSGTLFNIALTTSDISGTGTVTINSVTLRDCSNALVTSTFNSPATVNIDYTAPTVSVTSPTGTDTWVGGSSHAITWSASDNVGGAPGVPTIDLEYSTNGGSSWSAVAGGTGIPNDGSFTWTVPNTASLTAVVRATAHDAHGNNASASSAVFKISQTTTTVLTTDPNPSIYGGSVLLTATMTPAAASGSVEFYDGATLIGTGTLALGVATTSTSALAGGSHSLTAKYLGDSDHEASTSSIVTQVVNVTTSSVELTSAPNPSIYGGSVLLTATMTPLAASGSVEFYDGATLIGTGTLALGVATTSTSALAGGSHSLTAKYLGDTNYGTSTSGIVTQVVDVTTSSVVLTSAPNPSIYGGSVLLTATMTPTAASGSVEFYDGATLIGTGTLALGVATTSTSALAGGSHSLTAKYLGDTNYGTSTSSIVTQVVDVTTSSVVLTSAPNPSIYGGSVLLTATMTPLAASGSVEFYDGATLIGTGTLALGVATTSTSALAGGSHSLTAKYLGDTNYGTSTSGIVTQVVDVTTSSVVLTSAPNPSIYGGSVLLTATMTPTAASGSVEFYDGATLIGTGTLALGVATTSTSALAGGSHSLTAKYLGDTNYGTSTSGIVTQVVDVTTSSVVLTSAPNPSIYGGSVLLTATMTPTAASGSVEFYDGATLIGTGTLTLGVATTSTSALAGGSHSLTAKYLGDTNYGTSTSGIVTQVVDVTTSSVVLTSAPNPSIYGGSVLLTATMTPTAASGSVEFYDGATLIGTGTLALGVATTSTSALAGGSHSLTAKYLGDTNYGTSTSSIVMQVVNALATSVALTSAPNPSIYGGSVLLTATMTPTAASGSVRFLDGVTLLGTGTLSSGTTTLSVSTLSIGVHTLTAEYVSDGSHAGSTSSPVSHEVKISIVATAGANGTIAPPGTTTYSLGETPTFTFAGTSGYHVASVTVDGGAAAITSPYVFSPPLTMNHTIDVQFALNPPVGPITALAASALRTGNDGSGIAKIHVSWPAVPAGSVVHVYRAPYGNYPFYNTGATPGSVPAVPSYPPSGAWTLAGTLTSPVSVLDDTPATRDFWYYVAFVEDGYGTVSAVSNRTTGALDYFLGDVTGAGGPGHGDNLVNTNDISILGNNYGLGGVDLAGVEFLDVGPTTDHSVIARPAPDSEVDFEDLVMFAINYGTVSAPQNSATPVAATVGADQVLLDAPAHVAASGTVTVRLLLRGTGRVQAVSTALSWDPAVVEPVDFTAGSMLLQQGGVAFSAKPGSVDAAVLGVREHGLTGEGDLAVLRFRAVAAGDAKFAVRSVDARDAANKPVAISSAMLAPAVQVPLVTSLSPVAPNPFAASTVVAFGLSHGGHIELTLYSVDGRRVRSLANGPFEAGGYRLVWDGRDDDGRPAAPGVYYARLDTAQGRFNRKLVLTR